MKRASPKGTAQTLIAQLEAEPGLSVATSRYFGNFAFHRNIDKR